MKKTIQLAAYLLLGLIPWTTACNSDAPDKQAASLRSNSNDDEVTSDLSVSSVVRHTNLYLRFKFDCKEPTKTFQYLQVTEHNAFTTGKDDASVHQMQWNEAFEEENGSVLNIRTLRMDLIKSWQIQLAFLPTDRTDRRKPIKSNTLVLTGDDLQKEAGDAWEGGDSYEMLVTATCKDGNVEDMQIQRSAWTTLTADGK